MWGFRGSGFLGSSLGSFSGWVTTRVATKITPRGIVKAYYTPGPKVSTCSL